MQKYVKGDVSIRDSFKINVSQRGLGSYWPHGTRAGLKTELQVSPEHVDRLVSAACLLHSLIIDNEGTDDATLQKTKSSDTAEIDAPAIRGPRRYSRATREVCNIREREGVRYVETQLPYIMLTTCFGHCRP